MEHQIGRLSVVDTEPSCSLTVTFFETYSFCMYVYVRNVHYVHLHFWVRMCHEVNMNSIQYTP